ncbi:thiamine pyrophosphate-binding protein [Virgibacillus kimchii]
MLGRDLVLEAFRKYEVDYLFGNPGTTELPLMDGLVNYPEIEFIVSLHEDICVGMAAGYAQATGKPGVVNLHAAPGLAHGLGNIYNAYRAGVPLIVTAGQQDTRLALEEPALWGDMVPMIKDYTKWSWEVKNVKELPKVLHRAFKVATTHPMGPVFISLPSDILWEEVDTEPIPLTTIAPEIRGDANAIQETVNTLRKAENPVIVAGDRVAHTGAVEELVELAELIGSKVYVEHQSSSLNFPYAHQQFAGRCLPNGSFIKNALEEADAVLFIGVISQAPLLYFDQPLIESQKIFAIDNSEWEIGKNMHVDVPILGHIKTILQEVVDKTNAQLTESAQQQFEKNKMRTLTNHEERLKRRHQEIEDAQNNEVLTAVEAVHTLNDYLPEEAFIVDESVTSGKYVHEYLQLKQPNSLIALKGGGLGYGMPASLGAQLGRPDKRVVNVIGDGSSLYYIQSLWGAAKFNLPIIFFVLNNQSYMILKGGLVKIGGESAKKQFFPGMDLNEPAVDFSSVAKGFGIEAHTVTTREQLHEALKTSFGQKNPVLLDIHIDPTVKVFLN